MIVSSASSAQTTLINYFAELKFLHCKKKPKTIGCLPKMMEVVWTKKHIMGEIVVQKLLEYPENSEDSEWIKREFPNKKVASKYGGIVLIYTRYSNSVWE